MIEATDNSTSLPKGWVRTQFGDILEEVVKVQPREKPNEAFTYIDIAAIDNRSHAVTKPKSYLGKDAPSRARQLVRSGDVLFSTVRTYLRNIALVPEKHDGQIASTGFCVIRAANAVSPKYVFYLVQQDCFVDPLSSIQRGTSYPAVRNSDVYRRVVPLAPANEQKRIVAKVEELFTRLDAGVEALKKVRQGLKRYRQAVLKHAFEGKLTAEWRKKNKDKLEPASKLLERIAKERDKNLKGKAKKLPPLHTSDLPELPEGWEWATLEQLSAHIVDCLHSTPKFSSTGKYCVDTTCIEPTRILFDQARFVAEDIFRQRVRRLVPEAGDVLLAREGTIGTAAVVPENTELCLGQRMMMFRCAEGVPPSYFMYALLSPIFSRQWKPKVTGTTAPHVNIRDLRIMCLPVPLSTEQQAIGAEIERHFSIADQIEQTIEQGLKQSDRLRQSILKRGFEGKLVPQDPTDEPAEKLLERIKAERAKLQAAQRASGKMKTKGHK